MFMQMAETPNQRDEVRVALRYQTLNVPGSSIERATKVANDFAIIHFERHFSYDTDFIHLPCDFDCEESKNVWILCDFNVQNPIAHVKEVPLQSWKVTYNSERQPYVFLSLVRMNTKRHSRLFKAYTSYALNDFANHYPWGGRGYDWEFRLEQQQLVSVLVP